MNNDFEQARQIVIELQAGKRKKLPLKAPVDFMTPTWKSFVLGDQQQASRRAYEICVLSTLRDRLRSGDIFVNQSRKFADLESYLIPPQEWEILRGEVCQQLDFPLNAYDRLNERLAELESYLPLITQLLQQGEGARLEDGERTVASLESSELSDSFIAFEKEVMARRPQVDLTQLLVEAAFGTLGELLK